MSEVGNSEVQIKPPVQEASEPTKNLTEKFGNLFYLLGKVTRAKFLDRSNGSPDIKRPLFARTTRAKLYEQLIDIPKDNVETRKKIINEAHLRDDVTRRYLNQGEISVNLPSLGEQKARFIDVFPPEAVRTPETEAKPSIILIPGLSNDIECVGGLVAEMAMQGRRIIVIAHPESFKGKVTKEFAEAVGKDNGYGPHIEFFKQAIDSLTKENDKFELWGYSTGAPLIEAILNDPKFQAKTENAVLLCPASSVNQSKLSLKAGIINEAKMLLDKFHILPNLSYTKASKDPKDEEQMPLRKKVKDLMMDRVRAHAEYVGNAKVQQGGSIVVVSGRNDRITKSSEANTEFLQNPQVKILDLENGYHATPGVEPEKVLPLIFGLQRSPNSLSPIFSARI